MYAENELLFPPYVVPRLRHAKGEDWKELIDRVSTLPEDHPESLAFSLMMIHFLQCLGCETDCYRAMRGCTACALQALRRHKGGDQPLMERFERARAEVETYMGTRSEALPAGRKSEPARAA